MRVAGYMRLSRDEDKESYSSILSQKSIIEEYAAQQNWDICRFYIDDNFTGYSFDRPAFNQLCQDLENDRIDIIIAKDLSRIGRHNAYTLLFLDKVKKLGKRLILPREGSGYDTWADENDLLGITTWYNEMYVKDISRKIKSSIRSRQREGRMLIKEVFGYRKSKEDKHKLEIDPEAASIVKRIFTLYLAGNGYRKVAEILNHERYPTPSQYYLYRAENEKGGIKVTNSWSSVLVQRILKNDIYTGTLRLGKTEKKSIKGKSQKQPEAKQYIFELNHPAIVSKAQYQEVQKIAEKRRTDGSKGAASLQNLFSGLLYCQSCGSYMIAYKREGKPKCYICGAYHKQGKKACARHTVREDILLHSIMVLVEQLLNYNMEALSKIQMASEKAPQLDREQLKNKLYIEKQKCKDQLKQIILRGTEELKRDSNSEHRSVISESLKELEEELKNRLIYLNNSMAALEKETHQKSSNIALGQDVMVKEMINKGLSKKQLELLIDKILIDGDGTPTIYIKTDLSTICNPIREDVN